MSAAMAQLSIHAGDVAYDDIDDHILHLRNQVVGLAEAYHTELAGAVNVDSRGL